MDKSIKHQFSKNNTLAIIPCLNESLTIEYIIHKAKKYVDCVLVIDDGSSDNTTTIAKNAGAIVLDHKTNKGKSQAIKTGFHYAIDQGYDYVITIDGDGQHNPDEIPLLLNSIINDHIDLALGFRAGHRTEMPLWRKIGKRILDYTTSLANGGFLTDSQCGFRAFNRKALKILYTHLKGNGFSVESEQLIISYEHNLVLKNIPISCKYEQLTNTSKEKPAIQGLQVLISIIGLIIEKRPFLFFVLPVFIISFYGTFIWWISFQNYNQTSMILIRYSIIICAFFVLGILSLGMGIIVRMMSKKIRRSII
jgi:glycosyltransferase involved in cell wall biosynthesis